MNLTLVEITPDYCVKFEGKYLVRTVSTSILKTVHFLEASVTKNFDEKKKKWVMSIDISNQTATHISKNPLDIKS